MIFFQTPLDVLTLCQSIGTVIQPVSVTGGCTTLAVMPRGASSKAADIV